MPNSLNAMQSDLTGASGQKMLLCVKEDGQDLHPSNISILAGKADSKKPSNLEFTSTKKFPTKAMLLMCMVLENQLFYLLIEMSMKF